MNAHEMTAMDTNAPLTNEADLRRPGPDGSTRDGTTATAFRLPRAANRLPAVLGVALAAASFPGVTLAYVGPGAGLGAIGTLFGLVAAVVLALFGLFWYPIKRALGRRSATSAAAAAPDAGDAARTDTASADTASAAYTADTATPSTVESGAKEHGDVPPR